MGNSNHKNFCRKTRLCNWFNFNVEKGFTINKRMFVQAVKEIVIADGLSNPFHENKLVRTWFKAFRKRNAEITEKHAESTNSGRDFLNESSIRKFHNGLKNYLKLEKPLKIEP